ncbi:hypothetical protein DEU29_102140 [Idiomarina aquatica]|uniref:Uncharacterized protein n=1 Tax=Idiomarina aquatica TaxID=1327752 RepID=A0A4V3CQ13_9GAMM|nr:hypothetical protein DEU29_102140 [Idiomarina aquatica]
MMIFILLNRTITMNSVNYFTEFVKEVLTAIQVNE